VEKKSFKAGIYRFTGSHFIGPDDELRLEKDHGKEPLVICEWPPKRIDPRGLYCFVTTDKDTYSVRANALDQIEIVVLEWQRKDYMTHNQEVAARVEAMHKYYQTKIAVT
jgi:hypothetical protein